MSALYARISGMRLDDLPTIDRLERACFASPWSSKVYARELTSNPFSYYKVIRTLPAGEVVGLPPILGYGGCYVMDDEAHLMTVASHPDYRRCHLGEWMVLALLEDAIDRAVSAATLEVRVSNAAAVRLYTKLGFEETGLRRGYYPAASGQPREDALIMTLGDLRDAGRAAEIGERRAIVAAHVQAALRGSR